MVGKQGSKVTADLKRNRLYITFSSTAKKKDLEKVYTDIRFCVADLKPGFDVVTDLTRCTVGHLGGISTLRKIMAFLVVNKVGRVVRIVGEMSLVLKQLLGITAKFQGYKPLYVTTSEEAEEALSKSAHRDGLRFLINQRPIEYSTPQEKGKGDLVDISTSGCSVQKSTLALSVDEELSMAIPLYQDHDTLSVFTMAAKVIRVEGNLFAVQFLDLDDDRKTLLYTFLTNEIQRDIG